MLLTVKDLQSILGIGRDTAYALMHSQAFPAMKIGRRYFVIWSLPHENIILRFEKKWLQEAGPGRL